jgi:hypothetical protein
VKATDKQKQAMKDWRARHPGWKKKYRAAEIQWRKENAEHLRQYLTQWRKDHPDKHRLYNRKSMLLFKYGLTLEQYEAMLKQQRGRCSICRKLPDPNHPKRASRVLHVDHCHRTGKVRGLLCAGCNTAVGIVEKVGTKKIDKYLAKK